MTKINNCLNIISGDLAESYNLSENIISNSHMVGGTRQAKTFFQEISGMNITLPSEGIYEITANIVEDLSNISVNANSENSSIFSLYVGISEFEKVNYSERIGCNISKLDIPIRGITKTTNKFTWVYQNNAENNIVKIYGYKKYTTTGNWNINNEINYNNGKSIIYSKLIR
jgi:hypothetical protein